MKIVEIIGGLGNQMFQYALALSLKKAFPAEQIKLDISQYTTYHLHNGFELKNIFNIKTDYASRQEIHALKFVFPNYKFSRLYRRLPSCFQKRTTCIEAQNMRWAPTVLTEPREKKMNLILQFLNKKIKNGNFSQKSTILLNGPHTLIQNL